MEENCHVINTRGVRAYGFVATEANCLLEGFLPNMKCFTIRHLHPPQTVVRSKQRFRLTWKGLLTTARKVVVVPGIGWGGMSWVGILNLEKMGRFEQRRPLFSQKQKQTNESDR